MAHKARRRRHQSSLPHFRHSWVLQRPTGLSLQLHFQNTMASLQPQHSSTGTAQQNHGCEQSRPCRDSLQVTPESQWLPTQPGCCSALPSTAFQHHHRHLTIPQPVAGVLGIRPRAYPAQTSCTPRRPPCSQTHTRTHTHTRQGKVNTAAASSHQIRAEHHSLIVTA